MAIYFDWDENKNRLNELHHGIDFETASLIFDDDERITEEDSVVAGEQRWRTIGIALGISILLVVHLGEDLDGDLFVRMISARRATPGEAARYDQELS
jgi:uncharacterized DUF497 family protein